MAWGLRNEVDGSPLFDETAEPWKDLKQKEWKSDNKELGLEIRRRWEDYISQPPPIQMPLGPVLQAGRKMPCLNGLFKTPSLLSETISQLKMLTVLSSARIWLDAM